MRMNVELLKSFVDWSEINGFRLNASKAKEIVIDFSRYPQQVVPVNIRGSEIGIVTTFTYTSITSLIGLTI